MNLLEYQRSVLDVCFAAEPGDAQLASLGGEAARWRTYRHMVRSRLWSMAKVAFARTSGLAAEALEQSHARFLASHGPRSRFIREVVADFGRFALADGGLGEAPQRPALRDLLRFELARWELAYQPAGELPPLRELDFEGRPVLNPAFRVLRLDHSVHAGTREAWPQAECTRLFVYRPEGVSGVRWWSVDAFAAALFECLLAGDASVADAVRQAAKDTGNAVDQALLERLSSLLALAVERGVLLGCEA